MDFDINDFRDKKTGENIFCDSNIQLESMNAVINEVCSSSNAKNSNDLCARYVRFSLYILDRKDFIKKLLSIKLLYEIIEIIYTRKYNIINKQIILNLLNTTEEINKSFFDKMIQKYC